MSDNARGDFILSDALGPLSRLKTSAGGARNADADVPRASNTQSTSSFEFKGSRSDLKRLVQVALQAEISVIQQALQNDFKKYFADLDRCLEEKFRAWAHKAQRGEERKVTDTASLRSAGGVGSLNSPGIRRLGALASTLADRLTTLERRLAGAAPLGASLDAALGHDNVTACLSPRRKLVDSDAPNVEHLDYLIEALASRVECVEKSLKSAGVNSVTARPGPGPLTQTVVPPTRNSEDTGLDNNGAEVAVPIHALCSPETSHASFAASPTVPSPADAHIAIQISKLNNRLSNAERCIKWLSGDRETLDKVWEGDPLTAMGFQAAEGPQTISAGEPQSPAPEDRDVDHCILRKLTSEDLGLDAEELEQADEPRIAHVDLVTCTQEERSASRLYKSGTSERLAVSRRGTIMAWVDAVSIFVVVANAVFLGIAEEIALKAALAGEQAPSWLFTVNLSFAIAYLLEVIIRIFIQRRKYLFGPDRRWNILDLVLVTGSWLDVLVSELGVSVGRLLRCLRAFRLLRFLHAVRELRSFRIMVAMIQGSLGPLFFAICFLLLFTYALSIFISSGIVEELDTGRGDLTWTADVRRTFGSFWGIVSTLVASVTGGLDWMVISSMLQTAGITYVLALWLYVLSIYLGIFNVVTGIFVLGAHEASVIDHDRSIQTQMQSHHSMSTKLMSLLMGRDITGDSDDQISSQRLQQALGKENVVNTLIEMDTDAHEVRSLFKLLDVEGANEVPVKDLVMALLRLKGTTRNSDILTLIYSNRRLSCQMDECIRAVKGGLCLQTRSVVPQDMRGTSDIPVNFIDDDPPPVMSAAL